MAQRSKSDSSLVMEGSRTNWFSYTSSTETMRTWPYRLDERRDVPDTFLESGVFDAETFPYAVFVPENVVFLNGRAVRTRPKIAALFSDRLVVVEKARNGLERLDHSFSEIRYLRDESVLLSGVISVDSPAGFSRVGFNTVRDNLFAPILAAIRGRFYAPDGTALPGGGAGARRETIESVPGISFKFVNYAVRALLPGRRIEDIVFKDSANVKKTRKGLFRFLNHFTSPLLLIRTEGELVIIEEPAKIRTSRRMEYGGIFTYVPLRKITDSRVAPGRPDKLVLRLSGGGSVQLNLPDTAGLERFV